MSSSSAIVCREIFDENSQPSAEEISEYAQQLGIDPESESHLLPLAKEGLMQALPAPWKAYFDEKLQIHYYYNEETKKTQWDHPLDNVYKEMVQKARDASMHEDTCASVQELLTSEEITKNLERVETKVESDEDLSTDNSENQSEQRERSAALVHGPKRLAPLGRPPIAPTFDKKLAELRMSPFRKSLDSPVVAKQIVRPEVGRLERPKFLKQNSEIIDLKMHVLTSPEEENFNLLSSSKSDKGLPFSGKGGLFLKSEKTDLPSPDTEKSLNLESFTKSDPPKGILRDKLIDSLHKKAEIAVHGKPKQTASFEEDRKSVRFKLEHTSVETTISPGSNSSSEPNDGQSSIISATPTNPVTNPSVNSPTLSLSGDSSPPVPLKSNFMIQSATSVNQNAASNIHNVHMMQRRPTVGLNLAPIGQMMMSNTPVLSSLSSRPPLPPRPQTSLDQILSPRDGSKSITDSFESDKGTSPKRRMIRPPPGDYIKPDLFQKNFQKISDLVRPGDIDSAPVNLDEPTSMEKEARPRSPMIPSMKNKISINLMESIESETSIDSPDREFANLDLNDMDDSKHDIEEQNSEKSDLKSEKSNNSDNKKHAAQNENLNNDDSEPFSPIVNLQKSDIPQIKIPKLDKLKSQSKIMHSDSEESKNTSPKDNYKLNTRSNSLDTSNNAEPRVLSPHYKPNIGSIPWSDFDARSGRSSPLTSSSPWSKPYVPTPTKSPETSLSKGLTSPRLDGVIISQGKSPNRSDVVVMYQFENPKEDTLMTKHIKSPLSADKTRDMIERNKADERRRLELSLQKELEEMRVEWTIRERSMRAEMQEDLKRNEERFKEEKRVRLAEQLERHQRIIKEELEKGKHDHQAALEATAMEQEERFRRETALVEMEYRENLIKLQSEHAKKLAEERKKLESESERTLAELSEQLQTNLHRERARLTEENRLTAETLRQEHANRITDLKHDYRAEVERLRTQHACHLEELRARLSGERAAAMRRPANDANLNEKYKCLKEKYARLKHDVKMSIERRNKRREMSMTTGSETEKSNSHKNNTQSLERCKEANESLIAATIEQEPPRIRLNNNPVIKYNDNETSLSESNAQKSDNNNEDWRGKRTDNNLASPETSQTSGAKSIPTRRKTAVAFKEPPRRRRERDRDANRDGAVTTDCQDSSDATTADEKPKEPMNGHGRRRCFTRLKSASTSRLNYSPKRGDGWSSPLESLRQQLRKLDDLEDQFPDLACQPNYSLRYPFNELVSSDRPELEFVRHRALVEREGMRRARQVLRTRRNALKETRDGVSPHRAPSEERESTELEVALHRARALLGEKEIRLRHIERALRRLADSHPAPIVAQEVTTSDGSSGSEAEVCESGSEVASGAVLRSLRALHADVRDIWRALDARRPHNVSASPETSSCNAATSQPRMSLSAQEPPRQDHSDGGVTERARGLRAWLQTAP